jgi:hypothetical protein
MYDWEGKVVPANELETTLENVKPPWEVFAILPASAQVGQPFTGSHYLIVVRKPK